ncbi:MAG: hypothetical protein V7603_3250 [Micromonosporaceae bacterium]
MVAAGDDVTVFSRGRTSSRAPGMPSTPLVRTAARVLARDRERGEPPLAVELSTQREADLLAAH